MNAFLHVIYLSIWLCKELYFFYKNVIKIGFCEIHIVTTLGDQVFPDFNVFRTNHRFRATIYTLKVCAKVI